MNIDGGQLQELRRELDRRGYGDDVTWSEGCEPPTNADDFAREAVFVICNSGMNHRIAGPIFDRVMVALEEGRSARTEFGHPGKTAAIDDIWKRRGYIFDRWMTEPATVEQQLEFCVGLPWIGPITKFHLAKNFGVQVAKPDVHLQRLANAHGCTAQALCERLARETGLKVATVDVILWRACATGLLAAA
jgi:hypothetical protein